MKLITLLVVLLLITSPVCAQSSRLYTNADLNQPLTPSRPTVSAAQLASLAAHQFVYVPSPPDAFATWLDALAARSPIPSADARWPFATPPRPTFAPTLPLSAPWSMTAYVGRHGYRSAAPVVTIGTPPPREPR